MRKKLLALCAVFAIFCLAGTMAIIPARAGISTNSPTGSGLLTGGGELNTTNFVIMDDAEPSVYSYQKGNTSFYGTGWFMANAKFTNAARAADSRLTYKFDLPFANGQTDFSLNHSQLHIMPVVSGLGIPTAPSGKQYTTNIYSQWSSERIDITTNENAKVDGGLIKDDNIAANPDKVHIYSVDAAGAETLLSYNGGGAGGVLAFDGVTNKANCGYADAAITAATTKNRRYYTFWIEADMNGTLTFYSGYDAHDGKTIEKIKTVKITNAFTLPTDANAEYQFAFNFPGDVKYELDNISLYETHAVSGVDTDKIIKSCNFEDRTKVTGADGNGDFLSLDANLDKAYRTDVSEVASTNPNADTRISSINKLAVDNALEKTFEMNIDVQLTDVAATRKAGVAFGLKDYRDKLSAPNEGASFVYLTVNAAGKVLLGADNIAKGGAVTAVGSQHELTDLKAGADSPYINIKILGKPNGKIEVTVNDSEQAIIFDGLKLDGTIAITQSGTGNVTYKVMGNTFKTTGYIFTPNDDETVVVTSKFNDDWINSNKFVQSTASSAPPAHMVKGPETSHDITGITAVDKKVGFYGTSTNSRLMFGENKYADFVMQFDYISNPVKKRGQLGAGTNRYSPFYILFGSREAPVDVLANVYALGLVDGNVAQDFWGAESLISPEGKFSGEGFASTTPLSVVKRVEDETPYTIPCKKGAERYFGMPDTETSYTYSFYNKINRVKLVVLNNKVALYAAEVGEDGVIVADYKKIYETKVEDSYGYVGFGTDSPGWAEIDNLAITPIAKSVAIEQGLGAVPSADLVADIDVANMDEDVMPTPLDRPVANVDAANKKISWAAVSGAKGYKVTVKFGEEVKFESETPQTSTEFSMSAYTAEGEYKVMIVAIAEDIILNFDSNAATVTYTVSASGNPDPTPNPDDSKTEPDGKGCGGCGGKNAAAGMAAIFMFLGVAAVTIIKRK